MYRAGISLVLLIGSTMLQHVLLCCLGGHYAYLHDVK